MTSLPMNTTTSRKSEKYATYKGYSIYRTVVVVRHELSNGGFWEDAPTIEWDADNSINGVEAKDLQTLKARIELL